MRAYDLSLAMRVMGLCWMVSGCGGDTAKPAADDDRDSAGESSCKGTDECATKPDGDDDAGTASRSDASAQQVGPADAGEDEPVAPDAGAAVCPLADNEDTCGTCLKFSCCEEITACGAECQALVECANHCPSTATTDACAQACFEKHASGMAAFTAFAGCVGVQCEAACSSPS